MTKPRTRTQPGLGEATGLPRLDSAQLRRSSASATGEPHPSVEGPPATDSGPRAKSPDPGSYRPRRTVSWRPEPTTGTRRKRESRPPVTVDDVGPVAVKLARSTRRQTAPKLLASKDEIAKAPLDARAAFVLSLVDGHNALDAVVDMAGMPETEVRDLLARLARLGLISLP